MGELAIEKIEVVSHEEGKRDDDETKLMRPDGLRYRNTDRAIVYARVCVRLLKR